MSVDLDIQHDINAINPHSVRWYYSATSTVTPGALDIPGKSDLTRLSDGDSLLLETVYRKHAAEYNKCWLQQQEALKRAKLDKSPPLPAEPKQAELEPRGPTVRAGYFEADIKARSLYPIYWPAEPSSLMRGTWFVVSSSQGRNLIPLRHPLACKLEQAWQDRVYDCTSWEDHKLQPEGVHAARVDLSDVSDQNYYALFCERTKIYLCSRDNLAFLKGLWTESPGAMLIRGYSSAIDAQAPQGKKQDQEEIDLSSFESRTVGMAVRHVVMAVHGIGQRMGGRTIVEDAQAVRSRINAMLDDHMPDEIGRGYIQVLPIQWRKNLDLEADRVADRIMPEGARTFRMLAHNTCVEVLMYMSPSHAQSIVDSVANNLNTTYLKFIRRHPEFNGKFSVLAYSLGSVLCYDLLSHQHMKGDSMIARGLDNLMARHVLAEAGGWPGVQRAMDGGSGSVTARTTGDSAFVREEQVPDAALNTATTLDSPGAAPNTSRSEGLGPTAAVHDTEITGDGEGKSAQSGGSSGWAAGLWKAITQSILPGGASDDGDHSVDAGQSKQGKETPRTSSVDRVSEILDAAPRKMKEEAAKLKQTAAKLKQSAANLKRNSSTGGNTVSQKEICSTQDSTPASGATTPAVDSPVAEGAPAPSLLGDRSLNGDSSAGDDEESEAGDLPAVLAGTEDIGRASTDSKGSGKDKGKKNGYRWRIPLPRSFRVKRKKSECVDGSGSQQSSEVTQGTESVTQSGPAELQADDRSTTVQEGSPCGSKHTEAGDGTEVCESSGHGHPGDATETVTNGEEAVAGASNPGKERDAAAQPQHISMGSADAPCEIAADHVGASESASAGNQGAGVQHVNGSGQQGVQSQLDLDEQALHTLQSRTGPAAVAEFSPPALGDVATSQGCSPEVEGIGFRPPGNDSTTAGMHVAGHAVFGSSRRLGDAAAAVSPAQADMVAASATQGHQAAVFASRDCDGDAVLNSVPAGTDEESCMRTGLDAPKCRRRCDSNASRPVSQLTSALNGSIPGAQGLDGPATGADGALSSSPTDGGTDTSAQACLDVQQNVHRSMSTELRQLLEEQAKMSSRIDALRAAMCTENTVFVSAPQHAATCASDKTQNGIRDVHQSTDCGADTVCSSQSSLQQQASAAAVPPLAAEVSLREASLQDEIVPDMGRHHTYGMGELMDEDGGAEVADAGAEHGAGSPVKSTIELARVLWPGNTLHELDQQEKVPLATQAVQYPKLFFEVDNFIMIGSPTGLFCALRGINPSQQTPLGSLAAGQLDPAAAPGCLPVCRRFYNVFHPYDPVAYRMEPLVQTEDVPKPQHVPYHKHGRKLHIGLAETSESVARTMNQWQKGVAHAFTFSFKRSKGGQHERTVAEQNLQQCSLISSILGAPVPPHPPELLTSIPNLDLTHSGLSLSIPPHPSLLHHSLSHALSARVPGVSHEGTNGASVLEQSTELQASSPVPPARNHGGLPPLAEESSQTSVLNAPPAAAGMDDRANGTGSVAVQAVPVPQRPASEQEHPLNGASAASEDESQHAKSAPSEQCVLSASSPELPEPPRLTIPTTSATGVHAPVAPNPVLPTSNAGSPVSSTNSTCYLRSSSCAQHQQQPAEQSSTLHRRSSLARLQSAAAASEAPPAPPCTHATYASISHSLQHRSPSMLSLPGAAASVDGSTISGFRTGSDVLGKAGGDASSMRLSKAKPTLARAGQFGPVSKGQGGSVGRLDFQLQEDFAELQWVGAFKAHFCYWKHDDVALLICRAACGYDVVDGRKEEQPKEEPPADHAPTSPSS